MTHRLASRIASALLTLGTIGPAQAIVGASQAGSPLGASMVMVLNRDGHSAGFCTGIVLAPTVVMTAAHCAPQGADLRIHFPDPGPSPVLLPVDGVARHPQYRPDAIRTRQRSVDLALIHLPSALPARFVPATVAHDGGATPGERFTLSGYGLGRESDPTSSGQLRSVELQARLPLSPVLLWADAPRMEGAGACTGDSGGPVSIEGSSSIVALTVWSAGHAGHQCGDLTQALWLAPYRGWIDGVLHGWAADR